MPSSAVIRTASDALLAKLSVLEAGHDPLLSQDADGVEHYKQLLRQEYIATAGSSSSPSAVVDGTLSSQKRQSPLVNAGYAVRMSLVHSMISNFIEYHQSEQSSSTTVQLIILGAGLDPLALHHLLASQNTNDNGDNSSPVAIRVWELDTLEICQAKREALTSQGSIEDVVVPATDEADSSPNDAASTKILEGTVQNHRYELNSCDLRRLPSVQTALQEVDRSVPTLILAELVLAYLGRDNTDSLLKWIATDLLSDKSSLNSAFVVYEPIGPFEPPISNDNDKSVVRGFQQEYCQHFRNKLCRGLAKGSSGEIELFCPLGPDIDSVQSRFQSAGFEDAFCANAGRAMVALLRRQQHETSGLRALEPFDEHAALALHLQTYAAATGFSKHSDPDLIRSMCPWTRITRGCSVEPINLGDYPSPVVVRGIQTLDQEQVRSLFARTYEQLGQNFSSVAKMVKTALKTDLAGDCGGIDRTYRMNGGTFLVAVENDKVIGCIGVRSYGHPAEQSVEIQRLLVHKDWRGEGIARHLFEAILKFCRDEVSYNRRVLRIRASTPAVLEAANRMYVAFGFQLEKEEVLGKMMIHSYVKDIT